MQGRFIRNDKKRNCTPCNKKIVDGAAIMRIIGDDGKIKGYACSEHCYKTFMATHAKIKP